MRLHTSVEETVYEEDIPANAMDKFLAVQAERFRDPIFRLFHTELEAVYEEKNRGLDNDNVRVQIALLSGIFPGRIIMGYIDDHRYYRGSEEPVAEGDPGVLPEILCAQ